MGSVMDSRYFVCPHCFQQFDWNNRSAALHDPVECKKRKESENQKKNKEKTTGP